MASDWLQVRNCAFFIISYQVLSVRCITCSHFNPQWKRVRKSLMSHARFPNRHIQMTQWKYTIENKIEGPLIVFHQETPSTCLQRIKKLYIKSCLFVLFITYRVADCVFCSPTYALYCVQCENVWTAIIARKHACAECLYCATFSNRKCSVVVEFIK